MIGSADSDAPLSQRDCAISTAILRRLKANRRTVSATARVSCCNEAGIPVLSTTYDDCRNLTITVISKFLTLHFDRDIYPVFSRDKWKDGAYD